MKRHPSRFFAVLGVLLMTACAAASTGGSPTAEPTTLRSEPSTSPTATEITTPEASPSSSKRGIPADAIVTARVDGLRVRATPGLDGEELGTLASGYESLVVDGPEMVDGLEWYLVSGLGPAPRLGLRDGSRVDQPVHVPGLVRLGRACRSGRIGLVGGDRARMCRSWRSAR